MSGAAEPSHVGRERPAPATRPSRVSGRAPRTRKRSAFARPRPLLDGRLIGAPGAVLVLLVAAPELALAALDLHHRDLVDFADRGYLLRLVLLGALLGVGLELQDDALGPGHGLAQL